MLGKVDNISNSKFRIHNEGKNLINNNKNDNFDTSNNYDTNIQKNYFIENKTKNEDFKKVSNNKDRNSTSERIPAKSKDKNIKSSKQLKSEINNFNNNINNNNNNKKENMLTSSFVFYKENKCISKLKIIYSSKQKKYISIILLLYSLILFLISILDLMRKIQKGKVNFLLSNLIIFIFEMICSCSIILFHICYYFINIGNNYIIYLVMSIIILLFSLIYIFIYLN